MRLGVNLGPMGDWPAMRAATQTAEKLGFDAVGFLDHYHTDKLEWPYISGWSAYGALALATSRIHLVPLVIDRLNYLPGVLAKETTTLALISGGRFELGIGAGDYFQEARAWGLEVPHPAARIAGLKETVTVLRLIWGGAKVTFEGEYLHLKDAAATPAPTPLPRVMVGAGSSRRLIRGAVDYADELNVYADDEIIHFARQQIDASDRAVALSVYVWDWPDNLPEKLAAWEALGVARAFLTFWHPFDRLAEAAKWVS
jgi:alkanesulfonate monooxygenase SsuD/methylene tetrahydromethanopterin reductase-like flavin-dependent oxidoreductase (luciferase family)